MITLRNGVRMTPGSAWMMRSASKCARQPDETRHRVLGVSIASRSRRQKRGARGWDGGKQIKGRKRHVIVDTLGLVLKAFVTEAD